MKDVQIQINLPNKYDAIRIAFILFYLMKFSWEDLIYRSYTHSTSEPSALPLRVTAVGRFALCLEHLLLFFCLHSVQSIFFIDEDSHPERA